MATQTTNLKLVKPEMSDYADIRDFSNNFEILDKAYGDIDGKYLPLSGGTMTGNINSSNGTGLTLRGATSWENGAGIEMRARTDSSDYKGCLILDANLNDDKCRLIMKPNGILTGNRDLTLQAKDNTGVYVKTNGTCGMSNGIATFEFNTDNGLYFNGGRLCKVFNREYKEIKKIDVSTKLNMSELIQGDFSLQIFQDTQTLWTEMYVLVWNTSGDKWFKFKSPVTWASQEGTFVVTSVGRISGFDNYFDNTCTWIDNNTFYFYSSGGVYQMYQFSGYATELIGESVASLAYDDEMHEMTVQTNAVNELQSINNQLNELNAAAVCAESIDGEDMYSIFKDGKVTTMNDTELNEYHDTLTDRRLELLKILQA